MSDEAIINIKIIIFFPQKNSDKKNFSLITLFSKVIQSTIITSNEVFFIEYYTAGLAFT